MWSRHCLIFVFLLKIFLQLEARLAQNAQKSKIDGKDEENRTLWEKERNEQKRLLTEAHNLAVDLQQQLKSRDEVHSKEKKHLLNRLESERISWEKKKSELEKRIAGVSQLFLRGGRFLAGRCIFKLRMHLSVLHIYYTCTYKYKWLNCSCPTIGLFNLGMAFSLGEGKPGFPTC